VYLSETSRQILWRQLHPGLRGNADFHYLVYLENLGATWPEFVAAGVDRSLEVGSRLLVVDTVGKFAQLGREDESSPGAVAGVLRELDRASASGVSPLIAKHSRKSGGEANQACGCRLSGSVG
jgi:hypothetical protein